MEVRSVCTSVCWRSKRRRKTGRLVPSGGVGRYQLRLSLCAAAGAGGALRAPWKRVAGGVGFREKVTLRPSVDVNDSFILFQVYNRSQEERRAEGD